MTSLPCISLRRRLLLVSLFAALHDAAAKLKGKVTATDNGPGVEWDRKPKDNKEAYDAIDEDMLDQMGAAMFKSYDRDNNGIIEAEEVEATLSTKGYAEAEGYAKAELSEKVKGFVSVRLQSNHLRTRPRA